MNQPVKTLASGGKIMKNIILTIVAALAVNFSALAANIGIESGTSYTTSTWVNGVSSSVGQWFLPADLGAKYAIANSTQGGRTSIGDNAFFLAPGTGDWNRYAKAYFIFGGGALSAGQSLSFDTNFLWNGGQRGFQLQNGGGTVNLLGVKHEWADPLVAYNGGLSGDTSLVANAYQKAVRFSASVATGDVVSWSISDLSNSSTLLSGSFTGSVAQLYFFSGDNKDTANQDNFGMFVNNINIVPEPSSSLLMGLGLAGLAVLRLRRVRKTV